MSKWFGLTGEIAVITDRVIRLVIVIAVLILLFHLGKFAITKLINRYSRKKDSPQVIATLTVLRSVWKYFLLLIAVVSVLNAIGMSITANSIMAAAGAGGLIIGIGAQDFVKDILNGLTIILENQFGVGDYIEVNGLMGTVVNMSLRTTRIIGDNSETVTVPNSQINTVINYSRRSPKVICTLCIAKEEDLQVALNALEKMAEGFSSPFAGKKPRVMGVMNIHPYGVEIGVSCFCNVGHMLDLRCGLYRAIAEALLSEGIAIVNTKINISAGGDE